MKPASILAGAAAAFLLCTGALGASYEAAGAGTLRIDFPTSWRIEQRATPNAVSLRVAPATGDAFNLQITAAWLPPERRATLTLEQVRRRAEGIARSTLKSAAESEAPLAALEGPETSGFHFSVTDRRDPVPPGEYRYLTQGLLLSRVGLVVFTLLHHGAELPERASILAALASASTTREATSAPAPQRDALQVTEREDTIELSVPVSRLVLHLPRGRLARSAGLSDHPRYFHFADGGLQVSGWFEPAQRYSGLEAFWEKETRGWRERGLPEAGDVEFRKEENWETVMYDSRVPRVTSVHLRAHRVQAGTWVDLHLSITSTKPSAELRPVLREFLGRVRVEERAP